MIAGAFASAASTVWPSAPGAPWLRTTFNSAWPDWLRSLLLRAADCCRPRRRWDRSSSCASLCAAESFAARMRPSAHSFRPPKGCRRTRSSIAVVPAFSIHLLLCSAGFHQPPRSYEEIRLLREPRPVVVASFGSTARADPHRPPWVSSLDVPPLPPPIPSRPRMDSGRRVSRHADPAGPACTGVHLRSVLRFASGFFPTRPCGSSNGVSRRQILRAVASGSRLLPSRPAKDFHLQSSAHARHTWAQACSATLRTPQPRRRKKNKQGPHGLFLSAGWYTFTPPSGTFSRRR